MDYRNFDAGTVLERLNIASLNAMQTQCIAALEENKQLILQAPTGSGKTLAYLLPAIEHLDMNSRQTQVLIIAPSRELALQIEKVFKSLGTGIKITCCYGGHKREIEENNLLEAPAVIVGTPGRLADHLRRGNIHTEALSLLILDEFDKTLEFGFTDEVGYIVEQLGALDKQILVSATQAIDIPDYMDIPDPIVLDFGADEENTGLELQYLQSPETDKIDTLFRFLCLAGTRSSIVFCNHRESVERCSALLKEMGIHNEYYHGAMEQRDRDIALCKFRNGSSYVLITTDIAARGLDITNIRYIIHYHLPHTEDIFTHRNGRTARMEASGTAVLLLGPEEELPDYAGENIKAVQFPKEELAIPERPKWSTLCFSLGKKDKVNKIDIVGYLSQKGQLKKEDIGLVEVKDFTAFAAVRKNKLGAALRLLQDERLKNKKVKLDIAK